MNLGVDHGPANGVISFNVARNHFEGTDGSGALATVTLTLTAQPAADLDVNGNDDPTQVDDIMFDTTSVYLSDPKLAEIRISAWTPMAAVASTVISPIVSNPRKSTRITLTMFRP